MTKASAIYHGTVKHVRRAPVHHEFEYGLYMLYLDLAELDELFRGSWLWSLERRNVYSFRRADYLGDPQQPLEEAVRDVVEAHAGTRPAGPVRMLTQLRSFGFVFNPVTFYYCFDADEELSAIVAEITNTPWGERHRYVLNVREGVPMRFGFKKEFHISPFTEMGVDYDWRFAKPGDDLTVHMQSFRDRDCFFDVHMQMERREWSPASLRKTVLRRPAMATKVLAGIYWQAFRLWWKRAPFHQHPRLLQGDTT